MPRNSFSGLFTVLGLLALALTVCIHSVHSQTPIPDRLAKHEEDRADVELDESAFDFVVVGAGSAGSVLAKRLSENDHIQVLVLEAGPSDSLLEFQMPVAFSQFFTNPATSNPDPNPFNWNYVTEPDPGLLGKRSYIPRGRVLGGSSTINAMIYNRGHRKDYDGWCAAGNPGWCWNDVLPFFKRTQNSLQYPDADHPAHGRDGEWIYSPPTHSHEVTKLALQSALNAGFQEDQDHTDGVSHGGGLTHVNMHNGARMQLAEAMFTPNVLDRQNLHVRVQAHATRILFRGQRATGVEFFDIRTNSTKTVYASKEVLLSAGAIASPQLLQLSGVGNSRLIRSLGIRLVNDLAGVGENLQDHPMVGITKMLNESSPLPTLDSELAPENMMNYIIQWMTTKDGPMASNVGEVFIATPTKYSEDGLPDIVLEGAPVAFIEHGFQTCPPGKRCFTLGSILMRSLSKGYVKINSTDPFAHPVIHHRYLSDPRDMPRYVEGLRLARKVLNAQPIADHFAGEFLPGVDVVSEEALSEYARKYTITGYHQCGTCKMGPHSDKNSVVNHDLKVHGMRSLRVIDASVIPAITHSNINAPTVMIAEKGAQMIADEHNLHCKHPRFTRHCPGNRGNM